MSSKIASQEDFQKVCKIYKLVDSMAKANQFDELDSIIRSLDISELNSYEQVGWLSATYPMKVNLPSRSYFNQQIEPHLRID